MSSVDCVPSRAITPAATSISFPGPVNSTINCTLPTKTFPTAIVTTPRKSHSATICRSSDANDVANVVRGTERLGPRSVQLRLARSVTFGVLGDDSQLYPSSKWATENQSRFQGTKSDDSGRKPDFVITSLDTRKHNPQSKHIFHISRINKKPVCNVQSWDLGPSLEDNSGDHSGTVYTTSYRGNENIPCHLVRASDGKKPIEGIVPVNEIGSQADVRSEMMLPVCDSTAMPSAHNPHRYLLRKRKVPPPYRSCGVVYPNLEKPRMTSYNPGQSQTGDLPFPNEQLPNVPSGPADSDRVSVMSLSGMDFSRRKYIQPPSGHILGKYDTPRQKSPVCVTKLAGQMFSRRRELPHPEGEIHLGFNGGVPKTDSVRFDDRMLPFMRAKTII